MLGRCLLRTISREALYLYHLTAHAYRTMGERAEKVLGLVQGSRMPLPNLVRYIVEHLVTNMTEPRAAGAIWTTMKLSTVVPTAIELLEDYRASVTRLAVATLSPRLEGNRAGAIRIGMQVVLATVTDAVLQPRPGPMAAGRNA